MCCSNSKNESIRKKKPIIKDKNIMILRWYSIRFGTNEGTKGRRDVKGGRGTIRRGSHAWDNVLWQPRVITLVTFNSPRIRNTACKSILSDRPIFSSVLVFIQTPIYICIYVYISNLHAYRSMRHNVWRYVFIHDSILPPRLHPDIPPFTENRNLWKTRTIVEQYTHN